MIKRVVTCFILSSSPQPSSLPSSDTVSPVITSDDNTCQCNNNQEDDNNINGNRNVNDIRIAIFRRRESMPTFPLHWAGISGSIEDYDEAPWHAACRELNEETNINEECIQQSVMQQQPIQPGGLYLDVPMISLSSKREFTIRVYPFVVPLEEESRTKRNSNAFELELRGTEHDQYKFVTIQELQTMEDNHQTVPGLSMAFHHATFGKYMSNQQLPTPMRQWSMDKSNGASVLTRNAIQLIIDYNNNNNNDPKYHPSLISFLRPTMIPIVNAMNKLEQIINFHKEQNKEAKQLQEQRQPDATQQHEKEQAQAKNIKLQQIKVLDSLNEEIQRSVDMGVQAIMELLIQKNDTKTNNNKEEKNNSFVIATFSRSSTIFKILQTVQQQIQASSLSLPELKIVCGLSTPGNEGELMAQDLNHVDNENENKSHVHLLPDDELKEWITNNHGNNNNNIDLLLVGSDCIMSSTGDVINKVGTKVLAAAAKEKLRKNNNNNTTATLVYCCADRFKLWENDIYPPPMEPIFEIIQKELFDQVLIPPRI